MTVTYDYIDDSGVWAYLEYYNEAALLTRKGYVELCRCISEGM